MKAVCIVASDNVVIDGDVVFNKVDSGFEYGWAVHGVNNTTIMNTWYSEKYSKDFTLKLKLLWFWHMAILRKSHVYLTGVLK